MSAPDNGDLIRVFGRIGLLSFGGPAAQIALMHQELVEKRDWLSEQDYLRALSLCMLLPGPEAMQLATYAGWRLRGTLGGLIGGGLFVLPGAIVIAVLAALYINLGTVPLVQAAFTGIKATVIVIVLQALLKVSRKALKTRSAWGLAALSFVGLFVFDLPFPVIIVLAGLYGAIFAQRPVHSTPPRGFALAHLPRTIATWGGLWLAPLVALWAMGQSFLIQVFLFFSTLAIVTFGGAYAVLAYMTQTVVQDYGWVDTGQMMDALGLAETTPGPLILVTEFVAILAGTAQGGFGWGIIAGIVALWATFIPCFLWIFAAAPSLDAIAERPRMAGALQAITAAVVGVILNLSIWFALHVLFSRLGALDLGPLRLVWPDWTSLNIMALGLTVLAAMLMIGRGLGLVTTLGLMALLGIALNAVGMG